MKKKKQKTIAKLIDDAAVLLQKIRRIEESDNDGYCTCVSCGAKKHWREMHGGHYISRTKTSTKLIRKNINPQCVSCNTYRSDSAKPYYAAWMIEHYGKEFVINLTELSKTTFKITRPEIEILIQQFKQELKTLEAAR